MSVPSALSRAFVPILRGVETEAAEALVRKGLLTVKLPKDEQAVEDARKIAE